MPLALLGFAGGAAWFWPFTVDDAFIYTRMAEHLVGGVGYRFNVDGPVVDALTAPPWVWAHAFGLGGAKLLGAALTSVALARVLSLPGSRLEVLARAGFLLSQPNLYAWSVAGLETGLAVLLLTELGVRSVWTDSGDGRRSLEARSAGRAGWGPAGRVGAIGGALAWVRPELVPLAAILLLSGIVRRAPSRTRGWATLVGFAALALAAGGYRLATFGHVLPLASEAKPADLGLGALYVGRGALVTGLGAVLLAGLVVAWRTRSTSPFGANGEGRPLNLGWLALPLALGLAVLPLSGGDWMPGFRLLVPLLPLGALLFGRLLGGRSYASEADELPLGSDGERPAPRSLASPRLPWQTMAPRAALALAVLALPALDLGVQAPRYRAASRARDSRGAEIVAALRRAGGPLALVDVGYFGWASGLEVVDLGGVTDAVVAARPGTHLAKRVDEAWLAVRSPAAIPLHAFVRPEIDEEGRLRALAGFPVERRVAGMSWVQQRFRVAEVFLYSEASAGEPELWYVLLTPLP